MLSSLPRLVLGLLLGTILGLAGAVDAAVTFDAAAENHGSTGTTIAVSLTIGTLTNGLAVVSVEMFTAGTTIVSSIAGAGATWQGAAFGTVPGNGGSRGEVWFGKTPSSGAQTVTVTFSATLADFTFVQVQTFGGVNQTTPLAGYVSDLNGTTSVITVTTVNGDAAASSTATATGPGTVATCTTTIDASFNTGGNAFGGAAHCLASGASTAFTWSLGGSGRLSQGVDVQAAGGAPAACPSRALLGVGC